MLVDHVGCVAVRTGEARAPQRHRSDVCAVRRLVVGELVTCRAVGVLRRDCCHYKRIRAAMTRRARQSVARDVDGSQARPSMARLARTGVHGVNRLVAARVVTGHTACGLARYRRHDFVIGRPVARGAGVLAVSVDVQRRQVGGGVASSARA